jgi:hypothetical protein
MLSEPKALMIMVELGAIELYGRWLGSLIEYLKWIKMAPKFVEVDSSQLIVD